MATKKTIYRVDVDLHEYGYVEVEADSADEAEEKVMNDFYSLDFFSHNSDYDIGDIQINP